MQKRKLGTEGLEISCIGLGCMGMSQAYGKAEERDDNESIKVIHRALELGVDFFDTAEVYGPFTNETLLGKALKGKRDKAIIATKFGWDITGQWPYKMDSRPEKIKQDCEDSLKRLGIETIDLFYQHRVDPNVPIGDVAGAVSELIKQGKVKYFGLSEAGVETIKRAHKVCKISALQSEYSLWERGLEEKIIPLLLELNIGLVPFAPLGRGFLSGRIKSFDDIGENDFRKKDPRYQGENFNKNLKIVEAVKEIAVKHKSMPSQIAIAWTLYKGDSIVPIPGTKHVKYLEENLGAADIKLKNDDISQLDKLSGIRAGERYEPAQMSWVDR